VKEQLAFVLIPATRAVFQKHKLPNYLFLYYQTNGIPPFICSYIYKQMKEGDL